jgi:hypothetical protein
MASAGALPHGFWDLPHLPGSRSSHTFVPPEHHSLCGMLPLKWQSLFVLDGPSGAVHALDAAFSISSPVQVVMESVTSVAPGPRPTAGV